MPEEAASPVPSPRLSPSCTRRGPPHGSAAAQAPSSPFSPPTLQDSALFSSRVLTLLRLHRHRSLRIYSCPAHSRHSETQSSARQASCCWDSDQGKASAVRVLNPGTASAPAEFAHPSTATVIASSCRCPSLCEQAACASRQTGAWRCSMRFFPKPLAICCL